MIVYNGIEMSPNWPAEIRRAQKRRTLKVGTTRYPRIPYGEEKQWADTDTPVPTTPCRDCGVLIGQLHTGPCCVEACPKCLHWQNLSCVDEGCFPRPLTIAKPQQKGTING